MLRLNSAAILSRFTKKKELHELFLTLHIKPYSIGAILLEKKEKNLVPVASYESSLEKHVDTLSPHELLEYADKAISSIENSVPHARDVEKTIFALPNHWVEEAKIKRDHLLALKKITDDLSLVPIGFLVSTEAIVHALQEKEGAPLSAILIEVINEELFLSLVKQGKILEEDRATIQESSIATAELLLHNLKNVEVLPSRILLLENTNSEKKQQAFVSHVWSKSIPFLHIPQVEVLNKTSEQESVIQGVADQLDLRLVLDQIPLVGKIEKESPVVDSDEDFGFVKEKDLSKMAKEEFDAGSDVVPVEVDEDSDHEELEQKIEHEAEGHSSRTKDDEMEMSIEQSDGHEPEIHHARRAKKRVVFSPMILVGFLKMPKGILRRPGLITIPIIGIGTVVLVWYVYTSYVVKTTVTIFAKVQEVNVDEKITLATSEGEKDDTTLPLTTFKEEEDGEVSIVKTGEKETGDKAKGEVTVFNKTEKEKAFSKGTVIVGTNKLEFLTQDDITISSTSAFSTEFSNKKVKIEAKTFGKESNLPSKTNFELKEFPSSSYFARNDQALSGGTKKTSQVVSEEDLVNLEKELVSTLSKKAKESVQSKLSPSQKLIETPLEADTSDSTASDKVGAEVEEVSISGKVAITLGVYNEEDMKSLVKNLKSGEVPSEYEIDKSHSSLSLDDIEVEDSQASARLVGKAVFQPKIEIDTLRKDVQGKTINSATKKISSIPGIGEVQIKQNISLPILGAFISRNANNIRIEVKAE